VGNQSCVALTPGPETIIDAYYQCAAVFRSPPAHSRLHGTLHHVINGALGKLAAFTACENRIIGAGIAAQRQQRTAYDLGLPDDYDEQIRGPRWLEFSKRQRSEDCTTFRSSIRLIVVVLVQRFIASVIGPALAFCV
jgi:hypothetical protein